MRRMLLVVVAMALVAAACGGDDPAPAGGAAPSTAAPTEAGPTEAAPTQDPDALITVSEPTPGSRHEGSVLISGTANVFEATVSIRILDAGGNELVRTFTTATCGTGCWGDYSIDVDFEVSSEQAGTVEVFEESAKDGSPQNVVTIPVILAPG